MGGDDRRGRGQDALQDELEPLDAALGIHNILATPALKCQSHVAPEPAKIRALGFEENATFRVFTCCNGATKKLCFSIDLDKENICGVSFSLNIIPVSQSFFYIYLF